MKCFKCSSRPATVFSFINGEVVYACRRHRRVARPDLVVGWFRLPRVKKTFPVIRLVRVSE